MTDVSDVLRFWFEEASPEDWFAGDPAFDRRVRDRFAGLVAAAASGQLDGWRDSARGCLALCLLLDQFPRHLYREDARAFAHDVQARSVARLALERGFDLDLPAAHRLFVYLPLQHSEDLADQRLGVALCRERTGDPEHAGYAERHLRIVERFGRFPHRNAVLGRQSTAEEEAFLAEEGRGF